MKKAMYTLTDGKEIEVEYDEDAPCMACGLPVVSASVGGTVLCPWCDSGMFRNGEKWTARESMSKELIRKRAKEIQYKNFEV